MDPEEVPSDPSLPLPELPNRYAIYMRLYLEFYTIICLLSVISNVVLLVAIVKFKKLRNVTNMILAQFCALQIVYSLFSPVNLRLVTVDTVTWRVYCVFNNIETSVLFCMCFFLVLLLTDWYIKVYKQHNYGKFTHVYLFVIVLIYSCLLCAVVVSTFPGDFVVSALSLLSMAVALFFTVYLIVLNIIHVVKKRLVRTDDIFNLGLIVCNITALCWFPTLVVFLLSIFKIYHPFSNILFVLIGFASPIVIAIYLYMYEGNFNVFLGKIATCKCSEYKNEELQEDRVVYNNPEVA